MKLTHTKMPASLKHAHSENHSKGKACMACGGGVCKMADGGEVPTPTPRPDYNLRDYDDDKGVSFTNRMDDEPEYHNHDPATTVKIPKSNYYAKGGEVSPGGEVEEGGSEGTETLSADEGLHHAMGEELMGALEKKDKKQIMSAIEAIVLSCMNKEGSDDGR